MGDYIFPCIKLLRIYPLVMTNITIENGHLEIVDLPIKNGDFLVRYVSLPEGIVLPSDHCGGNLNRYKFQRQCHPPTRRTARRGCRCRSRSNSEAPVGNRLTEEIQILSFQWIAFMERKKRQEAKKVVVSRVFPWCFPFDGDFLQIST